MKRFTTADIRKWNPCYDPSRYLAETWQGTALDILNDSRIPFQDRLWVIMRKDLVSEKLMRRFAVWCARQVQGLMPDERSLYALDVAEAYAENRWLIDDVYYAAAWEDELYAARDAANAATRDVENTAARAAVEAVAPVVVAWDTARFAALTAARDAARVARETVVYDPAWSTTEVAAMFAARDATLAAQERKLREMLIEGIETGDTK
jgi:hypothetical protein